jgi:hypothetical protein
VPSTRECGGKLEGNLATQVARMVMMGGKVVGNHLLIDIICSPGWLSQSARLYDGIEIERDVVVAECRD